MIYESDSHTFEIFAVVVKEKEREIERNKTSFP